MEPLLATMMILVAILSLRMLFLFRQYGLEFFEKMDVKYKENIITTNEKLRVVGIFKIMKLIKKQNPAFFYLFYLLCGITWFLILTLEFELLGHSS